MKTFESKFKTLKFLVSKFCQYKNERPSRIKAMRLISTYFSIANLICSMRESAETVEADILLSKLDTLIPDPYELIVLLVAIGNPDLDDLEKIKDFGEDAEEYLSFLENQKTAELRKESLEKNLQKIQKILAEVKFD